MAKKFKYLRDESRQHYGVTVEELDGVAEPLLQLGCLMRIADAAEVMAKNYKALVDERNYYESRFREESENHLKTLRQLRAAKRQITKLKNRMIDR